MSIFDWCFARDQQNRPSPRSGRQPNHYDWGFYNRNRCRPLRGLNCHCLSGSWGLRPRLYAGVRSADRLDKDLTDS